MMKAIKIILPVLIIALACVVQNIMNTKKQQRIRQLPMIIIAFIVMITEITILILNPQIIVRMISIIDFFAQSELLAANLILMVGYISGKLIIRPIITTVCKKRKLLEIFALNIYVYDEQYNEWFLMKKWASYRQYMLGIVCGMIAISSIYLGFTWLLGAKNEIWMALYPCAALVVISEIYGYINGQTKEEFEHSILGNEADARRVSNYYKLREILENLLPEPLLSAQTGAEFIGKETPADMIKMLKTSDKTEEVIAAEFFELEGRYKTADVDCVQATIHMMNRRNVVFFNPFYKDLSMYITLPLVHALLSGKKCTVLCGRKNVADDVKEWLTDLLNEYSHMKSLWRVHYLSEITPECEVGVLTFTQMYDKKILNINKEFLHETDFVIIIEPSIMLTTGQVALSIIAEEMSANEEQPVYCICDRYTDGLIDTMSHLLHSEIVDVVAVPVPRCNYTAMFWDSDGDFQRQQFFDKQTKYLGNGIELAAIAVKNQVPEVTWYSEKKAPIKDIKWISGQYHSTICRYMNQPSQQKNLYEKVKFVSNLWSAPKTKEQFVIAEDEFYNMFGIMRAFLSRGEKQVFVNILSENYLLRDYMRCNRQMFMSNPNAVPSYVPTYAKTERNTLIKLVLMMTLKPISEKDIQKELCLIGLDTEDVYNTLLKLLKKYTYAQDTLFTVKNSRTRVDELTTTSTPFYSVREEEFDKYFSDSLKNAYYILEEEKNEQGYIDAKLFSHVTQTILPGQFVTYDGKYYQVKYVSPQSGVVLRRASNMFDGRKYYRQIRNYHFDFEGNSEVISTKKIMDIEFVELRTDFTVDTVGYLELSDNHNLRKARLIDFTKDPMVSCYTRKYHNKSLLRIQLPESDEKICFTFCLLLSEVFKSVFPDGWQYLAVVTKRPDDIEGILNYVVYSATGDIEEGYIYIVEDSDVDIGLLETVEKNFIKLMEIVADFLDWHYEKIREPASKDPVPVKALAIEAEENKHRNLVVRMLDRIRKLFGGKQEETVKVETPDTIENNIESENSQQEMEDETIEQESVEKEYNLDEENNGDKSKAVSDNVAPIDAKESCFDFGEEDSSKEIDAQYRNIQKENSEEIRYPEDEFEPKDTSDPDLISIDGTDIFDNEGMPLDNDYLELSFQEMGLTPLTKSRYQKDCYLKYGFEEIDGRIEVDELRKYLRVRGLCNNSLTLARKREVFVKNLIDVNAVDHCDFCSLPLTGVSYEKLNDGRVRCNDCSASAIVTLEDFREIFYRCLETMEDFYDIQYRVPISVKMADAREIAKGVGMIFKPNTGVAPRVLGYAQRKHGKYSLIIENGSPRLAAIDTMIHEMTHIWQYVNWNDKMVTGTYGMNNSLCTARAKDIVYEGMAMWASIQYLYQIGETYYAARQEAFTESRKDIYGIGFRLYREQYPLMKDSSLLKYTPFSSFPTLEPEEVRNAVRSMCTEYKCQC